MIGQNIAQKKEDATCLSLGSSSTESNHITIAKVAAVNATNPPQTPMNCRNACIRSPFTRSRWIGTGIGQETVYP